ncbi:Ger(x)C family spore germination protein [Paenibacillus filicis]|uniref:Ger(X)C family spore germination protein n=1 Tax=Paenibacillus filicis TaxID=669464 RepID=A0ABU9DED4_9BACL
MKTRPLLLLLTCCLLLSLLTGCWSKMEVNDVGIVTAVGLDQTDKGKLLLSLELAIPRMLGVTNQTSGEKLETTAGWIVSAEGNTIMEAYRFIQQKLPRKIVFYHSKVIVIGEKLARSGILPVLDFFERYKQSQIRSHLLFTQGKAVDILKFMPKFEKLSSEIIREEAKSQISLSTRVLNFIDMLMSDGDCPIAAQVELTQAEVGSKNRSTPNADTEGLALKGAAIFKKDKLIGWLNEKETRGVLWLKGQMNEAVTTIEVPKDKGGGKISSQIQHTSTSIKPHIANNQIMMQVDAYADVLIFENSSELDLSKPSDVNYVHGLVADDIRERIRLICDKAQHQLQTDILGFGRHVYRHLPKEWRTTYAHRWDEQFPDLDIRITPHLIVRQVGLVGKPITVD